MKKILIPVDFSVCADNAVHYAIQLARVAKADIHICHAIVPIESNIMYGIAISTQSENQDFAAKTEQYLKTYADKIIQEENLNTIDSPTLTHSFANGTVKDVINHLIDHHDIDLIIMGLSGAGEIKRFMMGSNSRDLIEQTKVPILLIPRKAHFSAIKKIAFATDLNLGDINSIQNIARLFCRFEPEILLTHIDGLGSDIHNPDSPSNKFLKSVTGKINYSKIYYRHVQQKKINDGLMWLVEKGQIEILAMIHRHKGMFAEFAYGSHTQQMSKSITLPLLVLPEENEINGW
ncbi:universal stress protein [Pedobacter frigiditerrae]|uniref:Universal stress protein n=1 Tax=Pedobacter frigiditerrae TaxID=2530452 RepID=A0A4R0MT44_9SPHI|nr:universal stress protein [Pedobacter frigiditerrae]TCC90180.1 universal stress protein [Pedobacter frigiditerrae]